MELSDDPIEEIPDEETLLANVVPPQQPKAHYYRIGVDFGTTNFAFIITAIPDEEDMTTLRTATFGDTLASDSDAFLPMGRIVCWKVIRLLGVDRYTWINSMAKQLMQEKVVADGLVAEVYFEKQIEHKNPDCIALESGLLGFFAHMAEEKKNGLPRFVRPTNAQHKFGYMGIRCPEGDDNYTARKAISEYVVRALVNRWVASGLMEQCWATKLLREFAAKPDDACDAFWLLYAASMDELKITPSVPALHRLHEWLRSKCNFVQESDLVLTVNMAARFQRFEKKARKATAVGAAKRKTQRTLDKHAIIEVKSSAVKKAKKQSK